jgi:hypothetical protein
MRESAPLMQLCASRIRGYYVNNKNTDGIYRHTADIRMHIFWQFAVLHIYVCSYVFLRAGIFEHMQKV